MRRRRPPSADAHLSLDSRRYQQLAISSALPCVTSCMTGQASHAIKGFKYHALLKRGFNMQQHRCCCPPALAAALLLLPAPPLCTPAAGVAVFMSDYCLMDASQPLHRCDAAVIHGMACCPAKADCPSSTRAPKPGHRVSRRRPPRARSEERALLRALPALPAAVAALPVAAGPAEPAVPAVAAAAEPAGTAASA